MVVAANQPNRATKAWNWFTNNKGNDQSNKGLLHSSVERAVKKFNEAVSANEQDTTKKELLRLLGEIKDSSFDNGQKKNRIFFNEQHRGILRVDTKALTLVDDLMSSHDADVALAAQKLFLSHLNENSTQKAKAISSDSTGKRAKAFEGVIKFIQATDKEQAALDLIKTVGYVYTQEGDDKTGTWFNKGQLQETGANDKRVLDFFEGLRTGDKAEALLYQMLIENDFLEYNQAIRTKILNGDAGIHSTAVLKSICQQNEASSSNEDIKTITVDSPEEKAFLRSNNFKFNITKFERDCINPEKREGAVVNFIRAFELLSFRKANELKNNNGKPTKASRRIQKQQIDLVKKIQERAGRDPELNDLINTALGQNSSTVFFMHAQGAVKTAQVLNERITQKAVAEFTQYYNNNNPLTLADGTVVTTQDHLTKLQNQTIGELNAGLTVLADQVLEANGYDPLLNHGADGVIGDVIESIDLTGLTPASSNDKTRAARIKDLLVKKDPNSTTEPIFLEDAKNRILAKFASSTDPAVQYICDNCDRLFGADLATIVDRVNDPGSGKFIESRYIVTEEKFREALKAEFRKAKAAAISHDSVENALLSGNFNTGIENLIDGEHQSAHLQLLQNILRTDSAELEKTFPGHPGNLVGLLTLNIDDAPDGKSKATASRVLGLAELQRRVLATNADPTVLLNALDHLDRISGISLDQVRATNDLIGSKASLPYKDVINYRSGSLDLADLIRKQHMIHELENQDIEFKSELIRFARKETEILLENLDTGAEIEHDRLDQAFSTIIDSVDNWHSSHRSLESFDQMKDTFRGQLPEVFDSVFDDFLVNNSGVGDMKMPDHFLFSPGEEKSELIQIFIELWKTILDRLELRSK